MKHAACTSMMRSPVVEVLITRGSARGVDGSLSKSGTPEAFAVLVMRLTCPSWWYLFAAGTLVVPCANAGAVSAAKSPPRTIAVTPAMAKRFLMTSSSVKQPVNQRIEITTQRRGLMCTLGFARSVNNRGNRRTRVGIKEKDVKGELVRVRVCKREGCGQEIDR